MGRNGRWFGFLFSEEKKDEKNNNKRKKRWGCVSCSDFDVDSSEHSAAHNLAHLDHENEHGKHAYSEDFEIVDLANLTKFSRIQSEEAAAIKIQTAFRGYLARRALRALRGLVRLKSSMSSNAVKHQTSATLQCMQTMARVQAQIHSRRIRMLEENQALQRQLQLKHEREVEKLRMAEEWDDSLQSKEQIEAQLQNKQDAAIRRERALAYAFSHQWKSSSRSTNATFMDPNNPQWGWSWMERWMASRPWENKITTPPSKQPLNTRKVKSASPRSRRAHKDDDSNSTRSERPRRHSIGGSSIRDDESVVSIGSTLSNTGKVKPRYKKSPNVINSSNIDELPEKGSVSLAKKRLLYDITAVPPRRHSGPPRIEAASLKSTSTKR